MLLPSKFVNKPSTHTLKFHNRRNSSGHRLPFYGMPEGSARPSYWCIPEAGGYFGGNQTGKALARIYLQHLKTGDVQLGGLLQHILLGLCEVPTDGSVISDSLRGQVVGFCVELEKWLSGAVDQLDDGLEAQNPRQLLKQANDGLNFDSSAWLESLPDE